MGDVVEGEVNQTSVNGASGETDSRIVENGSGEVHDDGANRNDFEDPSLFDEYPLPPGLPGEIDLDQDDAMSDLSDGFPVNRHNPILSGDSATATTASLTLSSDETLVAEV